SSCSFKGCCYRISGNSRTCTFAFHDEISPKKMTAEALESVPAAIRIAAGDLGCSLPKSNDEADLVRLLVSYCINEMK
ncbi:hypothetical protein, partial [uncultured Sutterella sp.]